jgi:hypothetical protein
MRPYPYVGWTKLIGIWAQHLCRKLVIFTEIYSKWHKNTENDQLAMDIPSSNPYQFGSTNIWIGSHLQVVWDGIYHFLISLKSTDSIFQKSTVYFITRRQYRVGMDKMVHKHSKSLTFCCKILFEVIWCHHGPERSRAELFVATVGNSSEFWAELWSVFETPRELAAWEMRWE